MALSYTVKNIWNSNGGKFSLGDKGVKRDYTTIFKVGVTGITPSDRPSEISIYNLAQIPKLGDPHYSDDQATMLSIDFKSDDTGSLWTVTCNYSTDQQERDSENPDNPLLNPFKPKVSFTTITKGLERDKEGKKITNSANQFYKGLSGEFERLVITGQKTYLPSTATVSWLRQYHNKKNSAEFLGYDPGAVKLKLGWDDDYAIISNVKTKIRTVSFTFEFIEPEESENGWDLVLLDKGDKDINDNPLFDEAGQVAEFLLDGEGNKMEDQTDDPTWNVFEILGEADFNELNLDIS